MSATNWLAPAVRAAAIERSLKAGQTLFRRGNRTSGLYEIVEGKCPRACESRREGGRASRGNGRRHNGRSLFVFSVVSLDAIATTDAVVRLYPKAAILAELTAIPRLRKNSQQCSRTK